MIVRLIKKTKIYNITLPNTISGNYWITDTDYLGNARNLINVEESEGKWKIKSDFETKIMAGSKEIESAYLKDYGVYFLKINTDNEYVILYCSPSYEEELLKLRVKDETEIIIGSNESSDIIYNHQLITGEHAKILYKNGKWEVQDLNSKYGTYLNNFSISSANIEYGDIIFILGLKIIFMKDLIVINSIDSKVRYNGNKFIKEEEVIQKQVTEDNPDEEGIEFFKENDYFYKSPRFKTRIEPCNIVVDTPPARQEEDKTPVLYTVGPMLSMAMMSVMMGYNALSGVLNGTTDLSQAAPSLVVSGAMIATMLLWPTLQRRYQKKQARKYEAERQKNIKNI